MTLLFIEEIDLQPYRELYSYHEVYLKVYFRYKHESPQGNSEVQDSNQIEKLHMF